jgi:hypothetical protein
LNVYALLFGLCSMLLPQAQAALAIIGIESKNSGLNSIL